MAKVKTGFFCIEEKKTYNEGDEYTGKRKDLGDKLEKPKKPVKEIKVNEPKVVKKTAPKKAKKK